MALGAAKRRITRETVTEVEGDEAEETEEAEGAEDQHPEAPLFSPLLRRAKRIETVTVRRTDPEDLSKWIYLGAIPVDTTESGLKAKWGGGTYRLEAKNAAGQIVPDGVRPVRVSGDPIFESEVEERKWRKANGLPEKPGAAPAGPALSVTDLLRLLDEKEEKRRAEQIAREDRTRTETEAREEREKLAREALEARKQKEADDREERKLKEQEAREDRRRAEAREDEERRARLHKEDMERLAAQNTTALQQTQQFFTQLATVMKAEQPTAPASNPVEMLLSGVELAQKLGGGGADHSDEGPLAALVRRLPETLAEARRTGAAALSEIRRSRGGGGPAHPNRPDALTITGALATKAKTVLQKLQASGKDPEAEMDKLLTFAAASIPDPPAGAAVAPARRRPAAPARARRRAPAKVATKRRA